MVLQQICCDVIFVAGKMYFKNVNSGDLLDVVSIKSQCLYNLLNALTCTLWFQYLTLWAAPGHFVRVDVH